jgi:hypothetical protein
MRGLALATLFLGLCFIPGNDVTGLRLIILGLSMVAICVGL